MKVHEMSNAKEVKKYIHLQFDFSGKTPRSFLKKGRTTLKQIDLKDFVRVMDIPSGIF